MSAAAWQAGRRRAADRALRGARAARRAARARLVAADAACARRKLHLEPDDWRAGFLRADRERDIPMELQNDLRENMPQALLRDLYRPVHEERWIERELVEGTGDRGGLAAMQAARDGAQAAGAAVRRAGHARGARVPDVASRARRRALAAVRADEPSER